MKFDRTMRDISYTPNIRNIKNTHQIIIKAPIRNNNPVVKSYVCAMACILAYFNNIRPQS